MIPVVLTNAALFILKLSHLCIKLKVSNNDKYDVNNVACINIIGIIIPAIIHMTNIQVASEVLLPH
jgi:hypothetical protein